MDVFNVDRPILNIDELVAITKFTRPTCYRYTRTLCDSGLLARFGGGYSLGPKVIQLDYIIRKADPLLAAGRPIMESLLSQYDCDVQIISLVGDKMICSDHLVGLTPSRLSYGRGRLFPIFRGAGSKAILAKLPKPVQRKFFEKYKDEAEESTFAGDINLYFSKLAEIKSRGFAISLGELDESVIAIAAPIVEEDLGIKSAIAMVLSKQRFALVDADLAANIVKKAASDIQLVLTKLA